MLRRSSRKLLASPPPRTSLLILGLAAAATSSAGLGGGGAHALSSSSSAVAAAHVANARRLGSSDLVVSEACLGTMTFGVQNAREDAFAQLDHARAAGCNFIDTVKLQEMLLGLIYYTLVLTCAS